MARFTLEECVAYQLSLQLKKGVYRILYTTPAARDLKLCGQISDAASSIPSDISEGYYRFNPAEFANFVRYSRGSLQEVITRLPDGVAKGYYSETDIAELLRLAERLAKVLGGLYFSLVKQADARRSRKKGRSAAPGKPRPRQPRHHRPR